MARSPEVISPRALHDHFRDLSSQSVDVPGISVRLAARELNARIVHSESRLEAGRVARDRANRYIIFVTKSSPVRQRFTIAHEIAHVLLDRLGLLRLEDKSQTLRSRRYAIISHHGCCYHAAGCATRTYPELALSKQSRSLRGQEKVSKSAAFLAMAGVYNWSASVLQLAWDPHDERWITQYAATRCRPYLRPVVGLDASHILGAPDPCALQNRVKLPFIFSLQAIQLDCEVKRSAGLITLLADLSGLVRNLRIRSSRAPRWAGVRSGSSCNPMLSDAGRTGSFGLVPQADSAPIPISRGPR